MQQPLSPPVEPPTEPYPIDDAYFPPKPMSAYAAEDRAVAAGQDIQDLLMNIQNTQNRMNAAGPLQSGFYQPELSRLQSELNLARMNQRIANLEG